jgi:hypothetical protein
MCHCYDEGICRCRKIVDWEITDTDFIDNSVVIIKDGKKKYKMSDVEKHCIDTLIDIHGIRDANNFHLEIIDGYYGQEVSNVYCCLNDGSFLEDVKHVVEDIKEDYDKIKFIIIKGCDSIPPDNIDCLVADSLSKFKQPKNRGRKR